MNFTDEQGEYTVQGGPFINDYSKYITDLFNKTFETKFSQENFIVPPHLFKLSRLYEINHKCSFVNCNGIFNCNGPVCNVSAFLNSLRSDLFVNSIQFEMPLIPEDLQCL